MKINIPDLTTARVLVAGDVMLDQYWYGNSRRISPEAPVPVVHVRSDEQRAGGASNVALNIKALGATPVLLGLTGADDNARKLSEMLAQHEVEYYFQDCADHDTCVKLRIIAQHQQMIRLDFEDNFFDVDKTWLLQTYTDLLESVDVVILSDYNKGTLSHIPELVAAARSRGKPVIADPIGNDFTRYAGATLITPNRVELETVVGPCRSGQDLAERGNQLRDQLQLDALLITRGEEGMSLLRDGLEPFHLPTCAQEVFDVTGAGDTVIAAMATAMAASAGMEDAVALANIAAGVVVGKLGTATASLAEIHDVLHSTSEIVDGVLDEDKLEEVIGIARRRGERVIMTNGCFDILHVGHVQYLQQARELGDRLIVAVNADASVRQLKGEGRPVNSLQQRMILLAALECVDWVVPFEEDTPERLYCRLLPDVIVKGGDYRPDEVAGGDCVKANGGEISIIDFIEGHSTSALINSIRG
jgi:D-beta-D-heptose 7-phosphate kinase/D-beta-D-heptose 1-phosphate adenosyltransferase